MTGTPSGTTTACDGGTTRYSDVRRSASPRGYVGRKLNAKLRSEEHESYMRRSYGGRGRLAVQNPKVIRTNGCKYGGYVERRSRVLPREICLSVWNEESERGCGSSRKRSPGRLGRHAPTTEQTTCRTLSPKSKLGKPQGERWADRSQQNP